MKSETTLIVLLGRSTVLKVLEPTRKEYHSGEEEILERKSSERERVEHLFARGDGRRGEWI